MARNGTGTYALPQPAFTPGTTISSSSMNSDLSDIATALTQSISADGQTPITGILKFPNGAAATPSITFGSDPTTGMYLGIFSPANDVAFSAGGANVLLLTNNTPNTSTIYNGHQAALHPIGMIVDFAGTTAPSGWFLCFGQSLAAASYPELFAVLGTTYGTSAGNVVLPDCRGRASYGKDNMGGSAANRITVAGGNFDGTVLGGVGGAQNETLTTAQLPVTSITPTWSQTGTGTGTFTQTSTGTATFTGNAQTPTVNSISTTQVWNGSSIVGTAGGGLNATASSGFDTAGNRGLTVTFTPTGSVTAVTGITGSVTGVTVAGTISGTFGSGNSHPTLDPAIIFNKIIFAGRP